MRDDCGRDELTELVDYFASILVDVDDEMCGLQSTNRLDVDIFGSADLWNTPNDIAWMDAKAGASDELLAESEITE
jgi:hypothetical protein